MKGLPIGLQTIEKILTGDYVYVDKTSYAKQLIDGSGHYFLSRPRRFGKSLFLSTLKAIFQGKKDLFKDYAIYRSDYDWKSYPVVAMDFFKLANRDPRELEGSLKRSLQRVAAAHGFSIDALTVQEGLEDLVVQLYHKHDQRRVVILVDEYDKPIIDNLTNPEVAIANRRLLRDFFGMFKSLDEYVRFTFITGISRFSKVSLFSGANHLKDITMDVRYAATMGYTEDELRSAFAEHIQAILQERKAQGQNITTEDILAEVKQWYNGYRFSKSATHVYNPFSTLNFMESGEVTSYWYSTGTPLFFVEQIRKYPKDVIPLGGISVLHRKLLDNSHVDHMDLAPLMFQTGYLTIQDHNPEENSYRLDFPNQEVRESFFDSLLDELTDINPLSVTRAAEQLRQDLASLDLAAFFRAINIHFAKVPYHAYKDAREGFYQAIFFILLERSGIHTRSEEPTSKGRIDLVVQMADTTFILELKVDQSAEVALSQAEAKQYKERYLQDSKQIVVIGISFSTQSRDIADWQGKVYDQDGKLAQELQQVAEEE